MFEQADGAAGQDGAEGDDYWWNWGRRSAIPFRKKFRKGSIPLRKDGAAGQDGAEGEDYWGRRSAMANPFRKKKVWGK